MKLIKDKFPDCVIGLSDHTTSNITSIGAIALGAKIIERHFTDNFDRVGPDISCSMDSKDLTDLIEASKVLHLANSGFEKKQVKEEEVTINFAFSSVVSRRSINKNEILSYENLTLKRPSGGDFGPNHLKSLIGKQANRDIISGHQLKLNDVKKLKKNFIYYRNTC